MAIELFGKKLEKWKTRLIEKFIDNNKSFLDSGRSSGEKDHFFEQYRAVIQELCAMRYKFLGMPSIYIPTIVGGRFDDTSKSVSEETLRVLESKFSYANYNANGARLRRVKFKV